MPLSGGYSGGSSLTGAAVASALGYTPANESDTIDLLNSVAYLALLIGGLKGALVQLTDGFDDNYADETGIDTSNSSGDFWTAGQVTNAATNVNIGPTMTSDSAPSGYFAAATTEGNPAWEAFDKSSSTYWHSSSAPSSAAQTLQLTFPSAVTVTKYSVTSGPNAGNEPASWTFQGYNGSTWATLDTRTSAMSAINQTNTFTIASPGAYSAYKLVITATLTSGNPVDVAELAFFGNPSNAMNLQSLAPVTLKSAPSRVGLYVLATMGGGVLNFDMAALVSRDGATFTAGTLVAIATLGSKTLYELQGSDGNPGVIVTGQPSGTTPKYKIDTTATYAQTINGVSLRAA